MNLIRQNGLINKESLTEDDLEELGFDKNDTLTIDGWTITYIFYDIGRLIIKHKDNWGDLYLEEYFTRGRFVQVIEVFIGEKLS